MGAAGDTVYAVVVILVIVTVIGGGYSYSHVWADQGNVNWIGQKTFSDLTISQWTTPFSIATLHHGTLNFTTTGTDHATGCGTQTNMAGGVYVGSLIGVVKLQCGGYDLVNDP
jgi:hypothetical protein